MNPLCIRSDICGADFFLFLRALVFVSMGNILGSCIGSFSASCAIGCLSTDLSKSPSEVTNSLESLLTNLPILFMFIFSLLGVYQPSALAGLVIGTIVSNACMFCLGVSRRFYSLRFLVPLFIALVSYYQDIDPPLVPPPIPLVSFSIGSTICLSDIGLRFNDLVRKSFDYLYPTYWMLVVYQLFLAALSILTIVFSIETIGDWKYAAAIFLITILAIWDFGTQRGSIMSVAILVAGLVAILTTETCIVSVVMMTIYNNFVLHQDTSAPLPTDEEADEKYTSRSRFLVNTLLATSQFLIIPNTVLLADWSDLFLITGFAVYVWIILAPVVISSRVF